MQIKMFQTTKTFKIIKFVSQDQYWSWKTSQRRNGLNIGSLRKLCLILFKRPIITQVIIIPIQLHGHSSLIQVQTHPLLIIIVSMPQLRQVQTHIIVFVLDILQYQIHHLFTLLNLLPLSIIIPTLLRLNHYLLFLLIHFNLIHLPGLNRPLHKDLRLSLQRTWVEIVVALLILFLNWLLLVGLDGAHVVGSVDWVGLTLFYLCEDGCAVGYLLLLLLV